MIARIALIRDGIVENVIVADAETYSPPAGFAAMPEAEALALYPRATTPTERDRLAELREAWAQFPESLRPQFAVHFAAVRSLVQADMLDDAVAFVQGLDLPGELETYRADILDRLS